jgi:hypothetical protein
LLCGRYQSSLTPGRLLGIRSGYGLSDASLGFTLVAAGTAAWVDERSARLAANEAIFRAGNELIERAVAG